MISDLDKTVDTSYVEGLNINASYDWNNVDCFLELFNEVFKKDITREHFYDKHIRNPHRISTPICFYVEDKKVVGMNAFMGIKFKHDKSLDWISLSCDTAIASSQRGKGIFTKIVTAFEECDTETSFIIGTPNDNSAHGFEKMKFKKIAELTTMAKVIIHLGKNMRLRKEERIIESSLMELNSEELQEINDCNETCILRSNEYINYKLSNMNGNASIVCLYSGNVLLGYIITHKADKDSILKVITIDDWYIRKGVHSKRVFGLLIKYISGLVSVIKIPMVNVKCNDYSLLKSSNFFDYNKIRKRNYESLIVSPRGTDRNIRWEEFSIKYIDGDTILNV